jgi:NTE family protein
VRPPSPWRRTRRRIDLALQGGGAYGAFTWGVLDRLLEEERIEIDAIAGTSAGAMNAVVLAHGLAVGGRAGALEAMRRFWGRVSRGGSSGLAPWLDGWGASSAPLSWYAEWLPRVMSPYQFNPLDLNPLRTVLREEVDFDRLRAAPGPRLQVSATVVRTGRVRTFGRRELTVDAVLASACLPTLFRAIEIDGEAYWDGGFVANPPLLPLIAESVAHDLLLVQVQSPEREEVPTTSRDILRRMDEISFNAGLDGELRAIALVRGLTAEARAAGTPYAQIAALRLHRIVAGSDLVAPTGPLVAAWPTVSRLHRAGREAAGRWLERNAAHLGRRATMRLQAVQ